MQQQIIAANIHDHGHSRTHARDVRKVLVRSHADIYAAGNSAPLQLADHMQIGALVGDEVVGIEIAARLGQLSNKPREVFLRRGTRRKRGRQQQHRCEDGGRRQTSWKLQPFHIWPYYGAIPPGR
jgi:hypothetical protein